MFSWDDMQFFLAVAREGQLSRAARLLNTSHVTVSRRIDRLEEALHLRLFERNPRGYELTAAGRRMVDQAERMEAAASEVTATQGAGAGQAGPMRIAMPEGFGRFFAANLLPEFVSRFPRISLEMVALSQVLALSRREADISVTLDPYKSGPYRSEKIVDYTLHLYATEAYLAAHPPILRRADLPAHRFIGYIEEMIFAPGLDYLRDVHPDLRPEIKSASIFNQLTAGLHGLGVVILPDFLACRYPALRLLLPEEVELHRTYWLTCHRDVRQARRERAVIAFMMEGLRSRAGMLRHAG
ncbi:LysR family transcriptional regulator [Paenirhodobacter sp.]|uniref:LysR family transcriptional regulator n=1 Tax=Paenirhodobacter sp. TaxID=1965326 RepID=UPI003B417571